MAAQRRDARDDDRDDDREGFGDLGEFGITSDELPATYPGGMPWRAAWLAEQRARTLSLDTIEACYTQRMISGPAVDLLQDEFSQGLVPEMRYDVRRKVWLIWSAQRQRWYSLDTWEQMAQEALPVDHPERVTALLRYPSDGPQPRPFDAFRARQQARLTPPLEHPAIRRGRRETSR